MKFQLVTALVLISSAEATDCPCVSISTDRLQLQQLKIVVHGLEQEAGRYSSVTLQLQLSILRQFILGDPGTTVAGMYRPASQRGGCISRCQDSGRDQ